MLFNVTSTDYKSNKFQSPVWCHVRNAEESCCHPLIKKRDASQVWRISNLSFLGKLIEKAAVNQIQEYVTDNRLHNSLQSAHIPHHSVETALLKVQNDILKALDQRKEVILVLLDFTSAFDTIEQMTLHGRLNLKQLYRLGGTVLKWLTSYLSYRSHVVKVRDSLSNPVTNNCGVPQGSVIGPMLYTVYSAPISKVIEAHVLSSMLYADDTQIYLTFHPQDQQEAIMKLNICLTDIVSWVQQNMLKIYAQVISRQGSTHPLHQLLSWLVVLLYILRNLGVHMDRHLQLREHIKNVCSLSMSAFKRIAQIRHFMSTKTTEKLIYAFVTSRIDSCNALLFGIFQNCKQFKIVLQD